MLTIEYILKYYRVSFLFAVLCLSFSAICVSMFRLGFITEIGSPRMSSGYDSLFNVCLLLAFFFFVCTVIAWIQESWASRARRRYEELWGEEITDI